MVKGKIRINFILKMEGEREKRGKNKEEKIKNQFTNVKRLLEWYGRLI